MSRKKKPSVVISMIPVVLLVGLLSYCITVFGDGMLSGPSQLVLTLCTGVVVAISMLVYKQSWQSLENAMVVSISRSMSANLILLMVAARGCIRASSRR